MKQNRILRFAAVLCLAACLLASCGRKTGTVLTYWDGAFRSGNGKSAFLEAPPTYYALSALTDQPVATITGTGVSDIPLYEIENTPVSKYLADISLMLYYAESVSLPTLTELGATKIALYRYSETRVSRQLMSTLTNRGQVADLVRRAAEDTKIPAGEISAEYEVRLELLFVSEDNAAFGIMLEYRKFPADVNGHGTNFIYDRVSATYTPVGDVLENYFLDGTETGD